MKQHAKHPKASKVLGCCTLCWGIAAALFIFSGGVAVFNLTVEDAYFSAPLKCWSGSSDTHRLSERCQMYPGSITDLRLLIPLMPFISSADKYVRLERTDSWEVCYGFDENKLKPQTDADGCSINRRSAPKCGMGEGVNERWGILKNYDPNNIENLYARRSYRYAWRNTSVANFM